MSLRDDLEQLFTCTGRDTRYTEEWQEPYLRLRAALTPAAIKWLEALPELLEVEAKMDTGEWHLRTNRHPTTEGKLWGWLDYQHYSASNPRGVRVEWVRGESSEVNAKLIVRLRNALHEAAALHNATNEKEAK